MKKVLLGITLTCFLLPSVSISQDNTVEQKLITAGYLLFKESNELKILRSELSEIIKKSKDLNGLDNAAMRHSTMLIENIFLVETICMYESILLGNMQNMEESKKLGFYKLHHAQLKKDILNRLYLNYQSTQSNISYIDDKVTLQFADKAKQEMQTTLRLIEEVIRILQHQTK
jgi:hypothetical protein